MEGKNLKSNNTMNCFDKKNKPLIQNASPSVNCLPFFLTYLGTVNLKSNFR